MEQQGDLTEEQLRALYAWIDAIPLSRPKRNIARDFSDGVLIAEVIHAYFPQLVELHNFTPANSVKQKIYNFETLNQRVLKKLGYVISRQVIDDVVNGKPGSVEIVLNTLQFKMAKYRERKASQTNDSASPRRRESSSYVDDRVDRVQDHSVGREGGGGGGARRMIPAAAAPIHRQPGGAKAAVVPSVDEEILIEKEQQIRELQETVEILELKIAKLEQLVRLKDNKIQKLLQK